MSKEIVWKDVKEWDGDAPIRLDQLSDLIDKLRDKYGSATPIRFDAGANNVCVQRGVRVEKPQGMTQKQARQYSSGLYNLIWAEGGESLAAIGRDSKGDVWYAPVNWVGGVPCTDWSKVLSVELVRCD